MYLSAFHIFTSAFLGDRDGGVRAARQPQRGVDGQDQSRRLVRAVGAGQLLGIGRLRDICIQSLIAAEITYYLKDTCSFHHLGKLWYALCTLMITLTPNKVLIRSIGLPRFASI